MTREFYPSRTTELSRKLLSEIQELAKKTNDITLLGGWAVHALVEDAFAIESQDIDLLIHTYEAWNPCIDLLKGKGGKWRIFRDRRGNRFRDHRMVFPRMDPMAVDIFYTDQMNHELLIGLFGTLWGNGFKELRYTGFIPKLGTIILDKFNTIPSRKRPIKVIKDILDIYALIFHNKDGMGLDEIWNPEIDSAVKRITPILSDYSSDERCSSEVKDIIEIMNKRKTR